MKEENFLCPWDGLEAKYRGFQGFCRRRMRAQPRFSSPPAMPWVRMEPYQEDKNKTQNKETQPIRSENETQHLFTLRLNGPSTGKSRKWNRASLPKWKTPIQVQQKKVYLSPPRCVVLDHPKRSSSWNRELGRLTALHVGPASFSKLTGDRRWIFKG